MERALKYVLVAAGVTLLVGLTGSALVAPTGRAAVWQGAGIAFVIQTILFVAFFLVAFAGRPMLAHGLGMLGRLLAVGTVALFWVPLAGVPAAPLLFTMVAVLFVTTLVEPLFMSGLSTQR